MQTDVLHLQINLLLRLQINPLHIQEQVNSNSEKQRVTQANYYNLKNEKYNYSSRKTFEV